VLIFGKQSSSTAMLLLLLLRLRPVPHELVQGRRAQVWELWYPACGLASEWRDRGVGASSDLVGSWVEWGKGSVVHKCLVWCVKDRGKLDVWMKRMSLPIPCRLSIGSLRNGGSKF
jgi:hypothetical protein